MSARALRQAVRDTIRSVAGFNADDGVVEITANGEPWPSAGELFYAVHPGQWDSRGTENRSDWHGVQVTITKRITFSPMDRLAAEVLEEATAGLEVLAEATAAMIHGQYSVMIAANTIIGNNRYKFLTPLCFRGASIPALKGGDWFSADPDEDAAGLAITLTFRDAHRLQSIGDQT